MKFTTALVLLTATANAVDANNDCLDDADNTTPVPNCIIAADATDVNLDCFDDTTTTLAIAGCVVAPVVPVVPEVVDVNRDCLDDETGDAIADCTPAVPTWAAGLVCNDRGATPAGSDDDFKPPALVGTKLDEEMVAISSDNAGC